MGQLAADQAYWDEWICRGGSMIADPQGRVLQGPEWLVQGVLLHHDVDFNDCTRGHLDWDATGHYARRDSFRFEVEGLPLEPIW
jgi:nitrilase